MAKEPVLDPEEVATVLSGDNKQEPDEASPEGPVVFSLRRPVAIAPDEESTARRKLAGLAAALRHALVAETEAEIEIQLDGFQQERGANAIETLPQPAWVLSFAHEDGGGLALALDPSCALCLVELALGGKGNTGTAARAATRLEARVLGNLCNALRVRLGAKSGGTFRSGHFNMLSIPAPIAAPGQTLGVGMLKLKIGETERNGLLLSTADLLHDEDDTDDEADHLPGALAGRLEQTHVHARPVVRGGLLPLSDLTALKANAVLDLDSGADAPLELRVEGLAVFRGHVVRGEGGAGFRVDWRRGPAEGARDAARPETEEKA